MSSDEGEIVEATPLPRIDGNGDVDRTGRNRRRLSRTPEHEDWTSRNSGAEPYRRSRSPRGFKRSRDEPEYPSSGRGRDPRRFRVRYESEPRDDARRGRHAYEDPDRPQSRGSFHGGERDRSPPRFGNRDNFASRPLEHRRDGRNLDRGYDSYSDKRPRDRSRSPRGRRDRGWRDRGRFGRDPTIDQAESIKYSAQNERQSQGNSVSKRATLAEASETSRHGAKHDQGVSGDRITGETTSASTKYALSDSSLLQAVLTNPIISGAIEQPAQEEPEKDWDAAAAVDSEAAIEAEIQRRRRAREEALKRAVGAVTPTVQGLQVSDKPASSTPASTRHGTPHKTEANTPRSGKAKPSFSLETLTDFVRRLGLSGRICCWRSSGYVSRFFQYR